jgi:hypothetical protein
LVGADLSLLAAVAPFAAAAIEGLVRCMLSPSWLGRAFKIQSCRATQRTVQTTSSGSALTRSGKALQPTPLLTMSGPWPSNSNRP